MPDLHKKYLHRAGSLIVMNIVVVLSQVISLPIVVRYLGKQDYGGFRFVLTLQMYATLVSGNYITGAAKRAVARGLHATILYALVVRLPFLFLSAVIILIAGAFFPVSGALLWVMALFLVVGFPVEQTVLEYFVARNMQHKVAFLRSSMAVISAVVSVIAVIRKQDVMVYALAYLGSTMVMAWVAMIWVVVKDRLLEGLKKGAVDRACLGFGIRMIPVDLMIQTLRNASSMFVGGYFGMSDMAVFSAAKQVKNMAARFIRLVKPVLYADIASVDRSDVRRWLREKIMIVLGISLIFGFILAFSGVVYLKLAMPESYEKSVYYFAILSAGFPAGLATRILITFLDANMMFRELALGAFVPNTGRLILVIVLGFWSGIPGICIGSAIGSWLNLFYFLYLVFVSKQ